MIYLLRDLSGEIIASSDIMPDEFGFPVYLPDGRECYWAIELGE